MSTSPLLLLIASLTLALFFKNVTNAKGMEDAAKSTGLNIVK